MWAPEPSPGGDLCIRADNEPGPLQHPKNWVPAFAGMSGARKYEASSPREKVERSERLAA